MRGETDVRQRAVSVALSACTGIWLPGAVHAAANPLALTRSLWKGGRVVECGGLENRFRG